MADVRLTISGRFYDVSTSDGQEQRLTTLAALVDEKARAIVGTTEVRQLLFASLMLADELTEARNGAPKVDPEAASREQALEEQLAALQSEASELAAKAEAATAALAEANAKADAAQAEIESLRQLLAEADARPKLEANHGAALSSLADRIETLAEKFEQLV